MNSSRAPSRTRRPTPPLRARVPAVPHRAVRAATHSKFPHPGTAMLSPEPPSPKTDGFSSALRLAVVQGIGYKPRRIFRLGAVPHPLKEILMLRLSLCLGAAATLALAVVGPAFATLPASNPFAQPSTLPFQAPPFDKIKDADYQPALEEGMRQQIAEIQAIANNPAPPTFENTVAAMEKSGRLLDRVQLAFSGVVQANTNDTLDKVQTAEAPKLAAHQDAIFLNPKLFARVQAIYNSREDARL